MTYANALKAANVKHFEGYYESCEQVKRMTAEQLLQLLDTLYGRDNLPEHCTAEQLVAEALRQHEIDWRDNA